MENNYLRIENVSKTIKGNVVLQQIYLNVKEHEVLGIQGINGSGKTMLLRAVAGLIRCEGEIYFNETEAKNTPLAHDMGILIEHQGFLNEFTGAENLELLEILVKKHSKEEIPEVLREIGLDPKDKRKYGKYSLGMKQRLAIAQAMIYNPKMILLDEPTNALDQSGIELLEQMIARRRNQCTFMISSHDMEFLETVSDRIVKMEGGKLVDRNI